MSTFELTNIRSELRAALDVLIDEVPSEPAGINRERNKAVDHVRTALSLLTGSTSASIAGHPRGSVHRDET